MDMVKAEDEERDANSNAIITSTTSKGMLKKGLMVGKKILVYGFVATSAPLVLPGFVVASAIGLAVSMPCAIFFVSHSCTQNLMSKLLPNPSFQRQGPLLLEEVCPKQDNDIKDFNEEELEVSEVRNEEKSENEMVDVSYEENGTLNIDYGQEVLNEPELSHSSVGGVVLEECEDEVKEGDIEEEEMQKETKGLLEKIRDEGRNDMREYGKGVSSGISESDQGTFGLVENMEVGKEDMTLDNDYGQEVLNEPELSHSSVRSVVLEECEDEVKEGDIEEEEMQKETKGLLEKIRDEGRNDMRGEYAKDVSSGVSESDRGIVGLVVENMEVGKEDKLNFGTDEDSRVCKETDRTDDNKDSVCNEEESCELLKGVLELEVDGSNDELQKPMAETSEFTDGPIAGLLIETQVLDVSMTEDAYDVANDQSDLQENVKEELESTLLLKEELDENISDFVNQETQLRECNKAMDSSDADAREVYNDTELQVCDENRIDADAYSYTIDLHEEPSNVTVDAHTDSMEVYVSSIELESRSSECSSENNIVHPSEEDLFNEGNIWKQIHAIRKIIGYESTTQASCVDELKALYIQPKHHV